MQLNFDFYKENKMSALRIRLPLVLLTMIVAPSLAAAQDQRSPLQASAKQENAWPVNRADASSDMLVVTLAKPGVRQHCTVQEISDDALLCERHFGRKAKRFAKDDVLALIRPAVHDSRAAWPIFLGFFSGGGAIVYSAAVIASISTPLLAVAIPVALLGALVACSGAMAFDDNSDWPESVFYLRPGSQLQFELRS